MKSNKSVDYDLIASTYDQRYQANPSSRVKAALKDLVKSIGARSALEVGCGTGHWLQQLDESVIFLYGVDRSAGMLGQANMQDGRMYLSCAQAWQLPFHDLAFALIYCVNAFHHFDQKLLFIIEARRLLRPGGALSIVGMDPHSGSDHYYLYDYFASTLETDLARFPAAGAIKAWMVEAGFDRVEITTADQIVETFTGEAVFSDPFILKNSTSQLILLSDSDYQAGLEKIWADIKAARLAGGVMTFSTDIQIMMVTGFVRE